jgi:hypothetical protein
MLVDVVLGILEQMNQIGKPLASSAEPGYLCGTKVRGNGSLNRGIAFAEQVE